MHWVRGAAALVATATMLNGTFATLITVTEYPSACPNTHHHGHNSRSTKVVHSTVTVSPAPFTDHDANHGTPFFLEVQVSNGNTRQRRAAAPVYIMSTGFTTESSDKAAQYAIHSGMLTTTTGGYISAVKGTQHQPFAVGSNLKTENTKFKIHNGVITWSNSNFADGKATFFDILSSGHKNQGEILVRFSGPILSTWTPVVLAAVPATNVTQSASGRTTHTRHSHSKVSTSASEKTRTKYRHHSTELSAISQSSSTKVHTGHHRHRTGKSTGIKFNATTTTASRSTSSTNRPASPSGACGPNNGGYTCLNSGFGNCCSQYGHCGNGVAYCSAGCQSQFGTCWSNASTSSTTRSTNFSSTLTSMSMNLSSSSTVSISTPSSTFTSLSGPIGPNHPLNVSTSSMTSTSSILSSVNVTSPSASELTSAPSSSPSSPSLSPTRTNSISGLGSTSGSSSTASMTSTPSPAVPPCPSSSATLCGSGSSSNNSTTCSSSGGTPYNTTCGVEYQGTTIDTTGIVGLPVHKMKRAIEYSLADCQTLCDYYNACIAINYIGTNCTLLSQVTGSVRTPDSVGAAVPAQDVAAKTNPVTSSTIATTAVSTNSLASPTASAASTSSTTTSSTQQSSSMSTFTSFSASLTSSVGSPSSSSQTTTTSSVSSSPSSTITSTSSSSSASSTSTLSTSTSTNYLILASPTPCSFGNPAGSNEDDSFCEIALPFSMQMYSQSDTSSYASTNGLLSIKSGSSQYSNQRFPASNIPNNTVAPFWDDLYLRGTSSPQDGIFYQFNTARTAITYEYYLNRGNHAGTPPTSNATYHFTVVYDSMQAGVFTFTYYATGGDNGVYAAVGMQGVGGSGEIGTTYAFQSASINPGLVVKCTTSMNICVKVP